MGKSTRLTVSDREKIQKRLIYRAFADRFLALRVEFAAHAAETYAAVYSPNHVQKMNDLPAGWLHEAAELKVRFGDDNKDYCSLRFDGSGAWEGASEAVPYDQRQACEGVRFRVPQTAYHGTAGVFELNHPLSERWVDLVRKRQDLIEQLRTAQKTIAATLQSVSTVSALVKVWPEVAPFVEHLLPREVRLPAVPRAELNSLLDLPVEEAASSARDQGA